MDRECPFTPACSSVISQNHQVVAWAHLFVLTLCPRATIWHVIMPVCICAVSQHRYLAAPSCLSAYLSCLLYGSTGTWHCHVVAWVHLLVTVLYPVLPNQGLRMLVHVLAMSQGHYVRARTSLFTRYPCPMLPYGNLGTSVCIADVPQHHGQAV